MATHQIVIVGGGAAGIAVASSLLRRNKYLDITIVEPSDTHYYQPGWTMVGGGIFTPEQTKRKTTNLIPKRVRWIQASVTEFNPDENEISLSNEQKITYKYLVVCPGLTLNWDQIEGLPETLGKNGVTSNYRYDLAPYTWELVQSLKSGNALFTQPAMPIKCAGAPQKAMYLSADYWQNHFCLKNINVEFFAPANVLFGVTDYIPALMEYVKSYQAKLNFGHTLVKVDGERKLAYFKDITSETDVLIEKPFDMLHVVPPQSAPEFIQQSPLANDNGFLNVHHHGLQHNQYPNIYGLGDVIDTPNAKTAGAVRKQAPVVANNIIADMDDDVFRASYNGYGSCPLTVERGRIVLAEFGYGGKILNTFPEWLFNGKQATYAAWLLKDKILPKVYWDVMLKGYEILAKPEMVPATDIKNAI